jgi:hypothetical protein
VIWERGYDLTKVLYNCRKIVQLQFDFTTAKKCTTAISFHNCKIERRNNRNKCTTAISVHNCQKNVQLQKKCTTAKKMNNCTTTLLQYTKAEALMGYYLFKEPKPNIWQPFASS